MEHCVRTGYTSTTAVRHLLYCCNTWVGGWIGWWVSLLYYVLLYCCSTGWLVGGLVRCCGVLLWCVHRFVGYDFLFSLSPAIPAPRWLRAAYHWYTNDGFYNVIYIYVVSIAIWRAPTYCTLVLYTVIIVPGILYNNTSTTSQGVYYGYIKRKTRTP